MSENDLYAWLRLTLTPGVGPHTARKLLAAFGLPQQVFQQSPEMLSAVAGSKTGKHLSTEPPGLTEAIARTRDWLSGADNRYIVTLADAQYPQDLLAIEDPPVMLYVAGRMDALSHPRRIAMVGSRNPTPQGTENAHHFAQCLAQADVCVISGLALGIDAAAHEGALEGGGLTIAVVGTGLDRVYPRQHLSLAHRIVQQGALVSEYPIGTPPLAANFPKRNRIVSGLSSGTLVVEAALQSGSLITARQSLEQGREVFAIPGSIHSPQAKGCNALIRQGAKLVESAQDVLEDLKFCMPAPALPTAEATEARQESALLKALGHDPVALETLQERTGLSTADLQAALLELELEGAVRCLPGGLFMRLVTA